MRKKRFISAFVVFVMLVNMIPINVSHAQNLNKIKVKIQKDNAVNNYNYAKSIVNHILGDAKNILVAGSEKVYFDSKKNYQIGTFNGAKGEGKNHILDFNSGVALSTGHLINGMNTNVSPYPDNYPSKDINAVSHRIWSGFGKETINGHRCTEPAYIEFKLHPASDEDIKITYAFASEKYTKYAVKNKYDMFAIYVNDKNCAIIPSSTNPNPSTLASIGNINLYANSELYVYNKDSHLHSPMDGITKALTLNAHLNGGQDNTVKIVIGDYPKWYDDTLLFIKKGSVKRGTFIAGNLNLTKHDNSHVKVTRYLDEIYTQTVQDSTIAFTLQAVDFNGQKTDKKYIINDGENSIIIPVDMTNTKKVILKDPQYGAKIKNGKQELNLQINPPTIAIVGENKNKIKIFGLENATVTLKNESINQTYSITLNASDTFETAELPAGNYSATQKITNSPVSQKSNMVTIYGKPDINGNTGAFSEETIAMNTTNTAKPYDIAKLGVKGFKHGTNTLLTGSNFTVTNPLASDTNKAGIYTIKWTATDHNLSVTKTKMVKVKPPKPALFNKNYKQSKLMINGIKGALVKVYVNNEVVNTITLDNNGKGQIVEPGNGNYTATQTVNGVESDRADQVNINRTFTVPVIKPKRDLPDKYEEGGNEPCKIFTYNSTNDFSYTEKGATVTDAEDDKEGNILNADDSNKKLNAKVIIDNPMIDMKLENFINVSNPALNEDGTPKTANSQPFKAYVGKYVVKYKVTDSDDMTSEVNQLIIVKPQAPKVTVPDENINAELEIEAMSSASVFLYKENGGKKKPIKIDNNTTTFVGVEEYKNGKHAKLKMKSLADKSANTTAKFTGLPNGDYYILQRIRGINSDFAGPFTVTRATSTPHIKLKGDNTVTVKKTDPYTDEGYTATYSNGDTIPGDKITTEIKNTDTNKTIDGIDTNIIGNYIVKYTSIENNSVKAIRKVIVQPKKPIITVEGNDIKIKGEPNAIVQIVLGKNEMGALYKKITLNGSGIAKMKNLPKNKLDENFRYGAFQTIKNIQSAKVHFDITKGNTLPKIIMNKSINIKKIKKGDSFELKVNDKNLLKAEDNEDGDITTNIKIYSKLENGKPSSVLTGASTEITPPNVGEYTYYYAVTDSDDNTTYVSRKINVYPQKPTAETATTGVKVTGEKNAIVELLDKNGKIVHKKTADNNGVATFENLATGQYSAKQIVHNFESDESAAIDFKNKAYISTYIVNSADTAIADATLSLTDNSTTKTATTDSNGKAHIEVSNAGKKYDVTLTINGKTYNLKAIANEIADDIQLKNTILGEIKVNNTFLPNDEKIKLKLYKPVTQNSTESFKLADKSKITYHDGTYLISNAEKNVNYKIVASYQSDSKKFAITSFRAQTKRDNCITVQNNNVSYGVVKENNNNLNGVKVTTYIKSDPSTQADVNHALNELRDAARKLYKVTATTVDKTKLQTEFDRYKNLKKSNHYVFTTKRYRSHYLNILRETKRTLENKSSSQYKVNFMLELLKRKRRNFDKADLKKEYAKKTREECRQELKKLLDSSEDIRKDALFIYADDTSAIAYEEKLFEGNKTYLDTNSTKEQINIAFSDIVYAYESLDGKSPSDGKKVNKDKLEKEIFKENFIKKDNNTSYDIDSGDSDIKKLSENYDKALANAKRYFHDVAYARKLELPEASFIFKNNVNGSVTDNNIWGYLVPSEHSYRIIFSKDGYGDVVQDIDNINESILTSNATMEKALQVTFNFNGGNYYGSTSPVKFTVNKGKTLGSVKPKHPHKVGYDFQFWTLNGTDEIKDNFVIDQATTFIANYEEEPLDKSELEKLTNYAPTMKKTYVYFNDKQTEDKTTYDTAIANGKSHLNATTQVEINKYVAAIYDAIEQLDGEETDKTKLIKLVNQHGDMIKNHKYFNASPSNNQNEYDNIIDEGLKLASDSTATQAQVNAKVTAIETVINSKLNGNPTNLTALKSAIDNEIAIKKTAKYINANKANRLAYDEALQKAKAQLDDKLLTQINADKLTTAINTAYNNLDGTTTDKTKLTAEIGKETTTKNSPAYQNATSTKASAYDNALAAAKLVQADDKATQKEVDKAFDRLSKAAGQLDGADTDKSKLITEINKEVDIKDNYKYYNATNQTDYDTALANAKTVQSNPTASQAEVDTAYTNLQNAQQSLNGNPTNKDELKTEIGKAEKIMENFKYKNASADKQSALDKAYQKAIEAYGDPTIKQSKVDEVKSALATAITNLDGTNTNLTKLKNATGNDEINRVKNTYEYINASQQKRDEYDNYITTAKLIYQNSNGTEKSQAEIDKLSQAEVDYAVNKINSLVMALDGKKTNKIKLIEELHNESLIKDSFKYGNASDADKAAYETALTNAKEVKQSVPISQAKVDKSLNDLKIAASKLTGGETDKTALINELNNRTTTKKSYQYINATDNLKKNYDKSLSEGNDWLSEIKATQKEIDDITKELKRNRLALNGKQADLQKLIDKIAEYDANKNKSTYYNSDKNLQEEYTAAIEVAKNNKNNTNLAITRLDEIIDRINLAIHNLNGQATDKSVLNKKIKKESEIRDNHKYYNAESAQKSAYETALSNAKSIFAKANATQFEVDKAVSDLAKAEGGLTGAITDKTNLKTTIEQDVTSQGKYINASPDKKDNYDEELSKANKVYHDEKASQVEVDNQTTNLQTDIDALDGQATDKTALQKYKNKHSALINSDKYKNSTVAEKTAYDNAYAKVEPAINNATLSQKGADDISESVAHAIAGFSGNTTNKKTLKAEAALQDEIKNSLKYKNSATSLQTDYQNALDEAITILGDINATQNTVDASLSKLQACKNSLNGGNTDKTALKQKVDELKQAKKTYKYINDTANAQSNFDSLLQDAGDILGDVHASNQDVSEMLTKLNALVLQGTIADKSKLEQQINKDSEIQGSDNYRNASEKSINNYKDALAQAKAILTNENASTKQVADTLNNLITMAGQLDGKATDKLKLEEVVARKNDIMDKINSSTVDAGLKLAYETAQSKAEKILQKPNPTQKEVDKALHNLKLAIGDLKLGNANKTALRSEITKETDIKNCAKYKNASKSQKLTYDTALNKAKDVYADISANQTSVNAARNTLIDAYNKLKGDTVDKTALIDIINKANKQKEYPIYKNEQAEIKNQFDKALAKAEKIANSNNHSQQEIDNAASDLKKVLALLNGDATDKTKLQEEINKENKVKNSDSYKNASQGKKDDYNQALDDAKLVNDDDKSGQQEVDDALSNLQDKTGNLDTTLPSDKDNSNDNAYVEEEDYDEDNKEDAGLNEYGQKPLPKKEEKPLIPIINNGQILPDTVNNNSYIVYTGETSDNEIYEDAKKGKIFINPENKSIMYIPITNRHGDDSFTIKTKMLSGEEQKITKNIKIRKSKPTLYAAGEALYLELSCIERKGFTGSEFEFVTQFKNTLKRNVKSANIAIKIPNGFELVSKQYKVKKGYIIIPVSDLKNGIIKQKAFKVKAINPTATITEFKALLQEANTTEIFPQAASTIQVQVLKKGQSYHIKPYIKGYGDGSFGSNKPITRAEVATMLTRCLKNENRQFKTNTETINFNDVKNSDWFTKYVYDAVKFGLFSGYPDGTFKPKNNISRAELSRVIGNYLNFDVSEIGIVKEKYHDTQTNWARDDINGLNRYGISNGYINGNFKPNKNITRAEAVKMINKMLYRRELNPNTSASFNDSKKGEWSFGHIESAFRGYYIQMNHNNTLDVREAN